MVKLLKKAFFGAYMVDNWVNPLDDADQKEWSKIYFDSASNGKICALYTKAPEDQQKGTIVIGHPMLKTAKGYFLKSEYPKLLKENGFNVFLFDLNGFGDSSNAGFKFYEDVFAAGAKAKELFPEGPVGYHGVSLSALWAPPAFVNRYHDFNFAVLESSYTAVSDHYRKRPLLNMMFKSLAIFRPGLYSKMKAHEQLKQVKNLQSILFIYSKKDTVTPLEMGERLRNSCKIITDMLVLENVDHVEVLQSEEKEVYLDKLLQYFNAQQLHYFRRRNKY